MSLIRRYIVMTVVMMMALAFHGHAQNTQELGFIKGKYQVKARLGYNIGGTMPLGMPASIRKLNSYSLQMTPAVGADFLLPIDNSRGVQIGLLFEHKGMKEDANVKNYHMEITQGGQTLSGMFTGDVTTKVSQWMLSLPIQAVWRVKKVNLKFGPYVSIVMGQEFSGWAHSGYLRVNDPTGPKVELGEVENERGNYDFSEHLRKAQFGMTLGADWNLGGRLGLYADVNWGMTAIFQSDFHTIEQNLYPVYGQLGITYRIK